MIVRLTLLCLPGALAFSLVAPAAVSPVALAAAQTADASVAESPVGTWTTIDDESGKARSVVRIYEHEGELRGRIIELFEDPAATCDKCEGRLKDKPILGMIIMWGLRPDGDEWEGGHLFDPEKGETYRGKIWLENDDTLKVRGYKGPFYRTQTWHRVR